MASDDLVGLDEVTLGDEQLVPLGDAQRGIELLACVTLTRRAPFSPWMTSTTPSMWLISALPLGMRASNSSSTRGRPAVMSRPATPPVWNVRMVSCVPGSPIDWAAMMPTASPMPTSVPWPGCGRSRHGRRRADWQVSGERTSTSSMPAATIALAISSVISSLRSTIGSAPFLRRRDPDRTGRVATNHAALECVRLGCELLGLGARDPRAFLGAAVVVAGDDVLRDVDEATGQVARVGGAQGGVGQTLARAVGGDEVLEDGHALAEVAPHGDVDDAAGRVGHQAAHAAQLTDVALVTAGTGARSSSSPSRVGSSDSIIAVADLLGGVLPDVDDALVALVLGDEAALELLVDASTCVSAALSRSCFWVER